ncbi:MAG: ATP-binding protein [Rhodomicrobiaceae bacterium]
MHLKVLIIEDCEDDAILLGRYLKSCGFDPKWQRVDREEDLAEVVEDRRWDLVLCDLSMPQLTPFIAVDCVRQINPEIPILIVTGAVSENTAIELLQYGVQDVVLKDDLPRLKTAIMRELALARQSREKAAGERRFAAAIESLNQGVALFDADARLITCNKRYSFALDMLHDEIRAGIHYGALIDLAFERGQYLFSRDGDPVAQRLLAYDVPTGKYPIEAQHHDERWLEIQRHRTEDGGIVTVTTDITENKKREEALMQQAAALAKMNEDLLVEIQRRQEIEEALRESENRARAIFENAVDGVITFNEDNLIETVNPAAETIFGYTAEELKSLHVHHLMLLAPDGAEAAGGAATQPNLRLVTGWRKNGEAFPIELTISPIELNARTLYTGIIRDVTERTKLDRMKSEFVSVVSHELRTPLTSIRGSLALLNTSAVGELPPRAKSMVAIGLQNSERLVRLINDILDIEKIESGTTEFACEPLRIGTLLDTAVRENKTFLDEYNVDAKVEDSVGLDLVVEGDQGRLMQVLANLISNAAKYSPENGCITLGAEPRENTVRVWVKDEGPGVPESFRKQIFQKFSQADSSDTRKKGGTGLGLSITKAIIAQHKGSIDFVSVSGEGTTFYFDLPILRGATRPELVRQSA